MGDLRALVIIIAILAAITYGYFLYIRPAFGHRAATALALLVFALLLLLMVCRRIV